MADNKQYITQIQENGSVISEKNVSGEIYLSSKALAKEYFGDQEKTENFWFVQLNLTHKDSLSS